MISPWDVKPFMISTILCTIDFTDASKDALRWAVNISRQLKTHLTVLYVYRLLNGEPVKNGQAVQMKRKLEEDAKTKFASLEKEVLEGQGVVYDFITEVGFVTDRIADHAKNKSVRFLVMDKNMGAGSRESYDELIKHIDVPLVIVP